MEVLISIVVSIVVGAALIEGYAWLDPLAKWLIRRAALRVPEDYRATVIDMITADASALPHSLAKIVFVLYNCTFAIDAICQELFREDLQSMADATDNLIDVGEARLDGLLEKIITVVRSCQGVGDRLASDLERCADGLERRKVPHAQEAIDRFREASPVVVDTYCNFRAELENYSDLLRPVAADIRTSLAGLSKANFQLQQRLADDRLLDDEDEKLLDTINEAAAAYTAALEPLHDLCPPRGCGDPAVAAMKVAVDAFRAAARAVKQG